MKANAIASATYRNPVINEDCPDPTVIKASDGYFYVYSTQNRLKGNIQYIPIHKSKDLIHWDYVGAAFNNTNHPTWVQKAALWAPDINYINGKYVLYYAMGVWGKTYDSAIGVATADKPEGPFTDHGCSSLPLLKNVFKWARACNPSQPLTAGIWYFDCPALNAFQLNNSDVISYHNYGDEKEHAEWIKFLQMMNRPLICTEYMARKKNSRFDNIMPLLKQNKIVAINWGFVSGKTNTIFAWDTPLPDVKEPDLWFHDIYRQDGTPFDQKEIDVIKSVTSSSN